MKFYSLGWGVVIYAVLSLVWSGFVIYGVSSGIAPRLVELLFLVLLALLAGRSLHLRHWKDVLPYSAIWGCEAIVLDAIYTVPFSGWMIYQSPYLWLGYALIVLIPLFAGLFQRSVDIPAHYTT